MCNCCCMATPAAAPAAPAAASDTILSEGPLYFCVLSVARFMRERQATGWAAREEQRKHDGGTDGCRGMDEMNIVS